MSQTKIPQRQLAITASGVGAVTSGAADKATPIDADSLGLADSESSNVLKKLTWSNLKGALKAYFDTLYATASSIANAIRTEVVSIGTNSTVHKLQVVSDVAGVARFSTTATGNTSNVVYGNGSNWYYGAVGTVSGTGFSTGDVFGLGYAPNANDVFTPVITWTSGNSVGISTSTPRRKLDALDPSSPQVRWTHTDDTHYGEAKADSNGNTVFTTTGAFFSFNKKIRNATLAVYADNAAAIAGGLSAGDFYRTATGVVMVVY